MKTKKQKLTFDAFAAKAQVEKNALSTITAGILGGDDNGGGAGHTGEIKGDTGSNGGGGDSGGKL